MIDNVTFALNTLGQIGVIAFGLGVSLAAVLLVDQYVTRKGSRLGRSERAAASKTQSVDLMEALKESLTQRKTSTGAYPEEPTEGPQVYPKKRPSGAAR